MLHPGILNSYKEKMKQRLSDTSVSKLATSAFESDNTGLPTLATVSASDFIKNPTLQNEVFGPFSLIVKCRDKEEMLAVARFLKGQLTTTIIATDEEIKRNPDLISDLQLICGRMILNGVPTGVTVSLAMHHGGPYPATTDSRFTAVGADGIKRFARPFCYQNWNNELLPEALQNENPLRLLRTVNGKISVDSLET
jgi:NADP-dependent aldehyde dehydrogenase